MAAAVLSAQERIYSFSVLAGTASAGHVDGDRGTARFNQPTDVTIDQAGNLYVADHGNRAVRKITPAGVVSTVAGDAAEWVGIDGPLASAGFRRADGIEVDGLGNLFVADAWSVRRIGVDGQVTTFAGYAGDGFAPPLKADGTGTQARFNGINGLGMGPAGTLYVSDGDNCIRQITPAAVVTTLAGQGTRGQSDGQGSAAGFFGPVGIHVDVAGIAWIADAGNHTIRRIAPDGSVTTLAGAAGLEGGSDGIGQAASFQTPLGITGDLNGNLYVSDFGLQGIRKITPAGVVTTMAGKMGSSIAERQGANDGDGRQASFSHPQGLATDQAGNVYIADQHNNLIRKMTPSGRVTTVAGYSREEAAGYRDGRGGEARFRSPWDIAVTPAGVAYVAEIGNHVIRKIDVDGMVSTFAGKPGEAGQIDGTGSGARFDRPHALAFGKDGNLYVADASNAVRRITPEGLVTTLAGSASFTGLGRLAVAPDGNVWVTDRYHTPYGAARTALRRISATGTVTTESTEFWPHTGITDMEFGPDGTLYLADPEYSHVFRFKAGVMESVPLKLPGTGFSPFGLAIDPQGNVFLTENWQSGSVRIAEMAADGEIRIVGGTKNFGWKDGVGTKAVFNATSGLAIDGKGNLYIACSTNIIHKGTLLGAPVINQQPQGTSVTIGGSLLLKVEAAGEPAPNYQWSRDGVAISGATAATYTLSGARAADAGSYTVKVSNLLGSVTSQAAVVSVSAGATPPSGAGGGRGSEGGGGAPSSWFLVALCALGAIRWLRQIR